MVHEEGFRIEKDFQGEWYFQRPDGRAIAYGPVYSEIVSAETLPRAAHNLTDDFDAAASIHSGGRSGGRIEEPMVASCY
jgi:hypothetical protein